MELERNERNLNGSIENGTVNGEVRISNPHVKNLDEDHLYHIGLSNKQHDLKKLFEDVKFVCFGGTPSRMENFARYIARELNIAPGEVKNYAETTDRYVVYKAGRVLSVSHGIGIPSLSIVFQEIIKLLHYAGCDDVTFFRLGTSGGIGLEGGTVVVSDKVVNGALQPEYTAIVLGKSIARQAPVDTELAKELYACAGETDDFRTVLGTTLCAEDFYEGQGRTDGAFCDYDDGHKLAWLRSVSEKGVVNMEMESLGFIALCHRAGVRGAVCCVTLLNRLHGDGLTTDRDLLGKWQTYPQILMARYIKRKLQIS